MKTPISKETLKHHFTYGWWKYLLVLAAVVILVWLPFDIAENQRARAPEDKRIDLYVYGYSNTDKLNAYMEEIRLNYLPEMLSVSSIMLSVDDAYGPMQLTTYLAAGEGDLYLLPREEFLPLSSGGFFLPLEDDEELMAVFTDAGFDLRRGWRTNSETGETHLYGIPADCLPGLSAYCFAVDGFLSVYARNGNDENVRAFLLILAKDMINPPPETEDSPEPAAETPQTQAP